MALSIYSKDKACVFQMSGVALILANDTCTSHPACLYVSDEHLATTHSEDADGEQLPLVLIYMMLP